MLLGKKQGMNAALLSAAATALTVKGALKGPVDQGPTSLRIDGLYPGTKQYIQGILDLTSRMNP
jgi:hypothetical protein